MNELRPHSNSSDLEDRMFEKNLKELKSLPVRAPSFLAAQL